MNSFGKAIIIFFIGSLLISCNKSIYVDNNFSEKRIELNGAVSFEFGMPGVIAVNDSEYMKFMLDTGSTHSFVFKSFFLNSFETLEEFEERNSIDLDYSRNEYTFRNYNLKILNEIYNDDFVLLPKDHAHNYWGILGIEFFSKYKIVTIDYINKKIILNDNILRALPIKMTKDDMGHLNIPVKLNGKTIDTILDTGFGYFDNIKCIIQPKPALQDDATNVISENNIVELGGIKYKEIYAAYVSSDDLFLPPKVSGKDADKDEIENIVNNHSIIGGAFFDNHIIQFDMENMEFRIL